MRTFVLANLAGLKSVWFFSWFTGLTVLSAVLSGVVFTNRFCDDESDWFCVACPEHAECDGMRITDCHAGFVNDQCRCLETQKTIEEIRDLHKKVVKEFNRNHSQKVDELYEKFRGDTEFVDFKAALMSRGALSIGQKGEIVHSIFMFDRGKLPAFGVHWFTLILSIAVAMLAMWIWLW